MWHYFGFQPFLLPLVDHGGNMNKFVGWILLKGTINVLYTKLWISNTIFLDLVLYTGALDVYRIISTYLVACGNDVKRTPCAGQRCRQVNPTTSV